MKQLSILFIVIITSFFSCKKDKESTPATPSPTTNVWTECMNGISSGAQPISLVEYNNSIYCLTAYDKIYVSTDNGNSWAATPNANLPQDNSGGGTALSSFSVANNLFFVAQPFGEVYKSNNATNSWQIQSGLSSMTTSFQYNPVTQSYMCLSDNSIYVSYNYGNSWNSSSSGIPQAANIICLYFNPVTSFHMVGIFAPAGLYCSVDDGYSWFDFPTPQGIAGITSINQVDSLLFVGTNSGLYKSSDYISWSNIPTLSSTYVSTIEVKNNMVLVTGLTAGEVYLSEDSAQTFNLFNEGLPEGGTQRGTFINGSYAFVCAQGKLYRHAL